MDNLKTLVVWFDKCLNALLQSHTPQKTTTQHQSLHKAEQEAFSLQAELDK